MSNRVSNEQKLSKLNRDLMEACTNGDLEQVKNLVIRGADVNFKRYNSRYQEEFVNEFDYPIEAAAEANSLEVVKFLVESGADPNVNNSSVLHLAIIAQNDDMVDYLLTKFNPDFNNNYRNLIDSAVRYSSYSILDILQEAAIPLEMGSPLSIALQTRNLNMVRYLLDRGITLTRQDVVQFLFSKRDKLTDLIFSIGFKLLYPIDIVNIEDTDLLDFLFNLEKFDEKFNKEDLLRASINDGKIDMLKYLLRKKNYSLSDLMLVDSKIFERESSWVFEGSKETLNFLRIYVENIEREFGKIKDLLANRDVYSVIKQFI